MISNTDKYLETESGMKKRSVLLYPCASVFVRDASILGYISI